MSKFILWKEKEVRSEYKRYKYLDSRTIPIDFPYAIKYKINWFDEDELLFKWINENTSNDVTSIYNQNDGDEIIYFKDENDAILFKLVYYE